jgi:hypothetical protein
MELLRGVRVEAHDDHSAVAKPLCGGTRTTIGIARSCDDFTPIRIPTAL